jgi:ankyrin repeat protein
VKLIENFLDIIPNEDINMKNGDGRTLLHVAASYYSKEIIVKILNKGGNIMAQDKKNWLPLQFAIKHSNSKLFSLIIMGLYHEKW